MQPNLLYYILSKQSTTPLFPPPRLQSSAQRIPESFSRKSVQLVTRASPSNKLAAPRISCAQRTLRILTVPAEVISSAITMEAVLYFHNNITDRSASPPPYIRPPTPVGTSKSFFIFPHTLRQLLRVPPQTQSHLEGSASNEMRQRFVCLRALPELRTAAVHASGIPK